MLTDAAVTGLHRKSLLRLVHGPTLERAPQRPRVRRRRYGATVADVVRVVWESLDYVCAERLTPALLTTAQQLARWEELALTPEVEAHLASISRATVRGSCSASSSIGPGCLGASPNRPTSSSDRRPWSGSPGPPRHRAASRRTWCTTADPSPPGSMSSTLQLVDIAHGLERAGGDAGAQPDRHGGGLPESAGTATLSHHPPRHPDNGSEFFNDHLIRYFGEAMTGLHLSRRPYRKNDNRFVEQKNATLCEPMLATSA